MAMGLSVPTMSIFLSVVVCCVVFSWFRARELGIPWFSMGGQRQTRERTLVPRLSSGQPNYQSRAKRRAQEKKSRRLRAAQAKAESKVRKERAAAQPAVFHELHALTHSEEAANRLVAYAQSMNPGRDRTWCIEKAIYDIKRDRMA